MCEVMESYAEEYAKECAIDAIKVALQEGVLPEMLAKMFNISVEEIQQIADEVTGNVVPN